MSADGQGASHKDILDAVEELSKRVGFTDYDMHGQLIGTGLSGQLARQGAELRELADWRASLYREARIAFVIIGAAGVVIWFLVAGDVDWLFNSRPKPVAEAKK